LRKERGGKKPFKRYEAWCIARLVSKPSKRSRKKKAMVEKGVMPLPPARTERGKREKGGPKRRNIPVRY